MTNNGYPDQVINTNQNRGGGDVRGGNRVAGEQRRDQGKENGRHFVAMDQGTELEGIRRQLFLDRYALKNKKGEPMEKFPEQMWRRVAWAVAQEEKTTELREEWEEKFYAAMKNFRFCPAGRFLTSAGTGTETTMINCFVIPDPEDTRKGIIKTLERVTEISARGGGVGFNLSSLRPRGSYLKAVNGTSSGSVSWAELYSVTAHDIIQQGGTRRGALMMMLWDWHPDVEEFIMVKKEQGKMLGANLSVCVSDKLMKAVEEDGDWELKFPETDFAKYRGEWGGDLEEWEKKGYPVKVYKTIKARELWNLICESAWGSAEPGIYFMDRANRMNNTWYFEKNVSTNPCGEQPLPAFGVCNLSSINLSALVSAKQNGGPGFDWEDYRGLIKVGVRFLDNAVDAENYLYNQIQKRQLRERRLGLGTLGLADALMKMKLRYGSPESLEMIEKIYKMLRDVAYETSIELAKEKGAFPMFKTDQYLASGFMKTIPEGIRERIRQNGIRNALLLTEAPTGKIALLAGASSGIEPVFSFVYTQKDRLGERTMFHPLYEEWMKQKQKAKSKKQNDGASGGLVEGNLEKGSLPEYFVVADDLSPEEHVEIQALIQKYTDSSISKTVNAPKTHTVEEVKRLYELAYKTGCKGISYMREGSREGTLIRASASDKEHKGNGLAEKSVLAGTTEGQPSFAKAMEDKPVSWLRPMKVVGATYKMDTPIGRAFVTVNHDEDGSPVEVFINIGRAGSDIQAMAEALGRLISKSLKFNSNLSSSERAKLIVDQLAGIGSSRSVGFGTRKVYSLPDAVAKAMAIDMGLIGFGEQHQAVTTDSKHQESTAEDGMQLKITDDEKGEDEAVDPPVTDGKSREAGMHLVARSADICPDCGNATLVYEMGCKTCHGCGYSEC